MLEKNRERILFKALYILLFPANVPNKYFRYLVVFDMYCVFQYHHKEMKNNETKENYHSRF